MNVPKLRFKEFNGEYKNIAFDKLANYKKGPFGSSLKKDMFVPKDANSIKVYEQQNAIKKDWTLERYFITKEYYEKLKGFTVKPGDIIVSCAGTIGEYYVLPYNAEIGVINQALMRISTNNLINQNYFLYIFDNMVYHFSKTFSNGSAIKNIPPFSDLKKQIAYIPSIEEQNKVAQFLSLLDKKIQLQTKKIEALKLYKLSIKNKLFKSNINYEIRLNQLVKCESSSITLSDIQNSDGNFPIYGADGLIKNINFYNHNNEYIAIVKDGAGAGRTMICPSKSSTISTMNALVPILEYKATYILELLNSINFRKYIIGSGIPHIYFKDYGKEKIKVHSIDESNKISELFNLLDKKIGCSQYQIRKLKKLKKGLLQIMFV